MTFLPAVAEALTAAGWQPGHRDEALARRWALIISAYGAADGRRHPVVPAAIEGWASFGGLRVTPGQSGESVAPSAFVLDPRGVQASVDTLARLGAAVGAALTPLGEEGDGTGILSIDAQGRVFVSDHTGDWFLGETLDDAITALVLGRPVRRVSGDGTW